MEVNFMGVPITPLADYIVAQNEEAVSKTASGLYLPDKATEKPKVAKVIATGKMVKEIKVGDRVILKSYSTTDVKHDGVDYILVKEEDVLATVK
jgi:chaperonin GroES